VLIESPDIDEASVVGRPDERWGEVVVAVVVRHPGSTIDADGVLALLDGRKKDMIISGSENIYPAEIENVLIESPDIAEASVVGRPDERWGEIVVAVVVRHPGSTIDAGGVLALLEGRIARFKHPKDIVFADALPKTALGKVRKEEVRRFAAEASEAAGNAAQASEAAGNAAQNLSNRTMA